MDLVFMEIKPKLSVGAGIHYAQLKFTHSVYGLFTAEDFLHGTSTSLSKKVSLKNIGIPVQAVYDFLEKKVKLQAHAGAIGLKTFVNSSATKVTGSGANDPVLAQQELGKSSDIKGISLAAYIGVDVAYPVIKNNFIKIGYRYQWFFFSGKDYYENAKGNIFSKGILIGFEHKL